MAGKLYGIGVGPGDPELMTIKAVNTARRCGIWIVPGKEPAETVAYQIAAAAVKEGEKKRVVGVDMPMTKNQKELAASHQKAARQIMELLEGGEDAAFLTLGDPCIYSTFSYVKRLVEKEGYETEIINGIPSFLAASAKLGQVLTEGSEMLHVIPAVYHVEEGMALPGTRVLMKCGRKMKVVKACMETHTEWMAQMVERCGMEGEKVYKDIKEFPDEAGYYTLTIVKERKEEAE